MPIKLSEFNLTKWERDWERET